MSAPIKFSTKNTDEINKIASKIFNKIIDVLKNQKSSNVSECNLSVNVVGHGFRPFGNNLPTDYIDLSIKFGEDKFDGLGKNDVYKIGSKISALVKEQKAKRGWNGLYCKNEGVYLTYGNFSPDFEFPLNIILLGKPCNEFLKLNKLITKLGGKELEPTTLYNVSLFGKRGCYDESGDKAYICFNPDKCSKYITNIKKRAKNAKMIRFMTKEIDDIDTDYSIRYETECYGSREVILEMVIS